MPVVVPRPSFLKALRAVAGRDRRLGERIEAAVERFRADLHHPGLNFEKITHRTYCTIRVTRGLRIALRQSGPDTFDLIDIGGHDDIYRRQP